MSLGVPSGALSWRYCPLVPPKSPLEMLKCTRGCECSRAGRDAPALLVPRGPLNPSTNKLLSAASDPCRVWSGLVLVWDGDLHPSQVCLE